MRRGRPKSAQAVKVIQVKLRLYEGSDDDLIAFFEAIPKRLRSAMVKRALRSGTNIGADVTKNADEAFEVLDSLVS